MTQTIAIIVNAVLMAGIVGALAIVMRIPFRLDRRRAAGNVVYVPGSEDERELSRAA